MHGHFRFLPGAVRIVLQYPVPIGDTITAIASPPGRSTRALIRVSGPATHATLTDSCGPIARHGRIQTARFRIADHLSLPVLIIAGSAPRSYTGEDTAELLVPGNPTLADRVAARLCNYQGVRPASPGEFTARAFLNGKISLDQAEGVAAAIAARSDEQLQTARELLSGATGDRYRAWAEEVATLLALVEAGIDFSDQEDVVAIAPAELASRLGTLIEQIQAHTGAASGSEDRSSLPRVALAGAPNAGKSTLFNALLGRPRAVVSPAAGTTRDVIEEALDLSAELPGAGAVMLIDLAGLTNETSTGVESLAQSAAARAIESADIVVQSDPLGVFAPLKTQATTIRVRTKADQAGGPVSGAVSVCALDGWNLGTLRRTIADAAWATRSAAAAAVIPRHRRALAEALAHLVQARDTRSSQELIAGSLRLALDSLGEVTGRISPDDVIGRIFSTFCIGK